MGLWKSLAGQVLVELTAAELEESLLAAVNLGLELRKITRVDSLTCQFLLDRKAYPALETLCSRRGDVLRRLGTFGLYQHLRALRKRPVLVLGMALMLAATLLIPRRVLFLRVEGNVQVPDRKILEAARESGLAFGTLRRQVRSEKIKNSLLALVPELQWAGVNTKGPTATISVRERPGEADPSKTPFGSLAAAGDGYILSMTVTKGTALCQPGQVVRKGQLLVSPYADYGLSLRLTGAEGDVLAQTSHTISAITPAECLQIREIGRGKRKISLTIGKKRINLWKDSGILAGSCDRMVACYSLTLPGDFRLPVSLWVETYTPRTLTTAPAPEPEKALSDFAKPYLQSQLLSGRILTSRELVTTGEGVICLTGYYVCTEHIGLVQTEQIGDTHGKND